MRNEAGRKVMAMALLLFCSTCFAQSNPIESAARQQVDSGNQAWIDGMKQGRVELIVSTYAADAVDCSASGECARGRAAIEKHMRAEMARLGRADSASVTSTGSVQQGHFVYEWGQAEADFSGGKAVVDRYLTAWQEQRDGTWKIFRNLVIPAK